MCSIHRVNGPDKSLKCLWTGYGSRNQTFVSRISVLLGFSRSTVSPVYHEWSTTQRTSRQFDTTVGRIGVNMGQHPYRTLSTPCRVYATTNLVCSEGKMGVQVNIRKVLFCTQCVCVSVAKGRKKDLVAVVWAWRGWSGASLWIHLHCGLYPFHPERACAMGHIGRRGRRNVLSAS
jgi:hypothetical protein